MAREFTGAQAAEFAEQKARYAVELADRMEFNSARLKALQASRDAGEAAAVRNADMAGRAERGELTVEELRAWRAQVEGEARDLIALRARMERELADHEALVAKQEERRARELSEWAREAGE